jgi:hypothetical protein
VHRECTVGLVWPKEAWHVGAEHDLVGVSVCRNVRTGRVTRSRENNSFPVWRWFLNRELASKCADIVN